VAWDVKLIDEESRQITISSGCHVNNQSSFDLDIVFSNEADLLSRSDDEDICRHMMMTVHEGVMNAAVPLDMMRCSCFQIRPTNGKGNSDLHSQYYQWSEKIKYKLSNRWSALKSTYQKRVVCRRLHEASGVIEPTLDRGDRESLYYSLHFLEVDRKLLVTMSSGLIIVNRLPCPVSAMCYNAKTRATAAATHSLTPSQCIESGASSSRPHIDVTSPMGLVIHLGDLISTEPLLIPPLSSSSIDDALRASPHEYQVFFSKSNDSSDFVSNNNHNHSISQLNLTVKTSLTDNGCLQVTIFSQFLLLDLSSTGIVVSSECDSPSSLQSSGRSSLQSTGSRYSSSKVDKSIITINRYSCSSEKLFATEKKRAIEEALLQSDSNIWLQRDVGVSLFQGGRDNSISLGVFGGKEGWYPNLSMDSLNSKKTAIEIIDTRSRNAVNIALTLTPLTAINSCSQTHLLTVIPCYVVVNYMDEPIEFLHPSCSTQTTESSTSFSHLFIVPAKSSQPWHRPSAILGTAVRLRTASSMASIGSVDLNEIGTTLLVLPIQLQPTEGGSSSSSSSSSRRTTQIVAHIEVKLAEDSDLSYMNIVVWQSIVPVLPDGLYDISLVSLSMRNETEIPFTLFQEDIVDIVSKKYNEGSSSSSSSSRSAIVIITEMIRQLEVCVEPGDCIPFGWVDASAPKKIAICAGKQAKKTKPLCTIDTLLTSVEERIDMSYLSSSSKNSISVSFHTSGNGKVLIIKYNTMKNSPALHFYDENDDDDEENGGGGSISNSLFGRALCLKLSFHGINVSMIADAPPMRRELFQACIQETTITLTKTAKDESMRRNIMLELAVKDVQIDNYCAYSTYPILLSSLHSQYRRNALKDQQRKQYFTGSSSKLSNGNDDTTTSSPPTTTSSNYPPFIQFLAIQEVPPIGSRENRSTIIKYLALRVLQFQVSVDASSIIAYFTDLHPSYNFRPRLIDANAVVNPECRDSVEQCQSKLQAFNQRVSSLLLMSCDVNTAVDVERAYRHAIAHKVCFESIIMHPFSITLTFSPNQIDRSGGGGEKTLAVRSSSRKIKLLHTLCSLPAIDGFDVHVGSFIVNYAMESIESMRKRITLKTELELRSNLIQLGGSFIGSMSILGKPAGMLKNIGGGVQDLFYEVFC
jgi:hypothetical protein